MSGINAPDPTEHFLLAEKEKKYVSSLALSHANSNGRRPRSHVAIALLCRVIYEPDTKITNTGTFTLNKEDHTMGNILRCQLLRDPRVLFAGYRMPHPLINHTLVRVCSPTPRPPRAVPFIARGAHFSSFLPLPAPLSRLPGAHC